MPLLISWVGDMCAHWRWALPSPWWGFHMVSLAALSTFRGDPPPCSYLVSLITVWCNGFDLVTCSGIVSQTRLGVAVPHSPAMCQRQQNSPGFSKLWAFSETGEDCTQTLPEPLSRPVPRLLDEWSCRCNDINAKSPPNKSKLHSVWSTACEVFLSSPLSLQTSLPRL